MPYQLKHVTDIFVGNEPYVFNYIMQRSFFHIAILTSSVFLFFNNLRAQEYIGLRMDNYSGSNGMMFNPALPGSGVLPWDVNVLAYGNSIDNNYAFIPQQSIAGLPSANSFAPSFYNPEVVKAFGNVLVQGPSAFIKRNDFTFGFYTAGRSAGFIITDSKSEGFKELSDIQKEINYNVPTLNSGLLNWAEIGFNGEMQIQDSKTSRINLAVNAKFLLGFDAYTGQVNAPFNFTQHEETTDISNFDYTYAYTDNLGSNRVTDISNYEVNGFGTSIDLGMTYNVKSKLQRHKNTRYDTKFGVALVDLGFIKFKKNAGTYDLFSGTAFTALNADIDSISDLDEFTKIASRIIYDNGKASKTGSRFTMYTPGALTLFADKNIGNGFFVNGMLIQRLSGLHKDMIARANIFAITPRFEKEEFAVSIPFVFSEYEDFHLGTAIRFYFLTIGSDDVLSLFVPGDLDGTDFYIAFRFNPYWLQSTSGGGSEFKINKRKQVQCPVMN
ncbi:MAG: hypothetical protein KBF51_05130 [Chitinophagales bacterium]|nr:hypothetical protein [Chitinophagales bacterium]MBP9549141.1 hypothetical protein [Chitinophagales bacterium]